MDSIRPLARSKYLHDMICMGDGGAYVRVGISDQFDLNITEHTLLRDHILKSPLLIPPLKIRLV